MNSHTLLQGFFWTQGSSPGLWNQGSPISTVLAGKFFTTASLGKPRCLSTHPLIKGLPELVWVLCHLVQGGTLFCIHPVWFHTPEENSLDGAGVWKARLFPKHPGFTKLLCNLSSRLAARPESTFKNVTNPQKGQIDKPSVCHAGLFEIEKVSSRTNSGGQHPEAKEWKEPANIPHSSSWVVAAHLQIINHYETLLGIDYLL